MVTATEMIEKVRKNLGMTLEEAVKVCVFTVEHLVVHCPISTEPDEREKHFHEHWNSVLTELVGMSKTKKQQQPHCCPVCSGRGIVPNGFYRTTNDSWSTSDITPDKCRSCDGTGLVWSKNDKKFA